MKFHTISVKLGGSLCKLVPHQAQICRYDNNEARGEHILDGDLLAKTRLAGLKIAATMAKFYPAARAMLSKAWPLAAREQRLPLASTS